MNFNKMRRISSIISRHGANLGHYKHFVIQKALSMFDTAIREDALPTIDTQDSDKRRAEVEGKKRNQPRPVKTGEQNKRKIVLKLKPRKEGDSRPTSPTTSILQKRNGSKWLRVVSQDGKLAVKQLDRFFVPTFIETEASEENIQPAKADSKGTTTMQKSKLENLIARARKNPAALSQQTLLSLNQHLSKVGMPTIVVPVPSRRWGTMPTVGDVARNTRVSATNAAAAPIPAAGGVFSQACVTAASQNGRATANLTGSQRAAMAAGLPADHPGLEKMSYPEMQVAAKQQQLVIVNAIRKQQGLPPIS